MGWRKFLGFENKLKQRLDEMKSVDREQLEALEREKKERREVNRRLELLRSELAVVRRSARR